jgi:hypothetical protein
MHRSAERRRIGDISVDDFNSKLLQRSRFAQGPHESADVETLLYEPDNNFGADIPARSRYQYFLFVLQVALP